MPASPAPTVVLRPRRLDVTPPPRPTAPGFEILEEVGRGGMGVVYRARQSTLNRLVALKMVLAGEYADESDQLRFLAEAEAVAAVKHPNVVEVYEFGVHRGLAYFAMELLSGGSLARRIAESGALTPDEAVRIVESVTRGVQAAHEAGFVHRDLKPANILFAAPGAEAKITDFGLAKRGAGYDLTLTGMIVGTPAYMSPEQAIGDSKTVGPPADIYSLGAILYECLTGVPPFQSENPSFILQQLATEEPKSIRSLKPDVPRDLDLICMKCLAKLPNERYATAASLADDLRRYREREPVSVRPAGRVEKAMKWARRNPSRATIYGMAIFVFGLLALSLGAFMLLQDARDARERSELSLNHAMVATDQAYRARLEAETARETLAQVTAFEAIRRAGREFELNDTDAVREALDACRSDLRPWEWHYLNRSVHRDARTMNAKRVVRSLAFGRDGRLISTGPGTLLRWDATRQTSTPFGPPDVFESSLSADGTRLLVHVNDEQLAVLDAATGEVVAKHQIGGQFTAISPDGSLIGAADHEPTAAIFDAKNGERKATLALSTVVNAIAFDPSGQHVAIAGEEKYEQLTIGAVRIFDPLGRIQQSTIRHGRSIRSIVFSPDGKRIASLALDGAIQISDVGTGSQISMLPSTNVEYKRLAFSPDGSRLVTGGTDRAVRIWDVARGFELFTFRGHHGPLCAVTFTPDGTRVLSTSLDGGMCEWDVSGLPEAFRMAKGHGVQAALSCSPDGERVLTTSEVKPPQLFDARTGKVLWTGNFTARSLQFTPDGRSFHGFTENGDFGEWDGSTGKQIGTLKPSGFRKVFARSDDGRRILTRGDTGSIVVYDVQTGERKCEIVGIDRNNVLWAAISPDGKRVATSGSNSASYLWDADTGEKVGELRGHNYAIRSVAFSPDGKRIVTGGFEGPVKVWDASTLRNVLTINLSGTITAVGYSPDSSRLIVCDWSRTIRSFTSQ